MVHEIIPVMIGEEETNARLYTYFWSNSKELYDGRRRPCVLICPGGGYEMLLLIIRKVCSLHSAWSVTEAIKH